MGNLIGQAPNHDIAQIAGHLTVNLNTTVIPQLGSSNTFQGTQSIAGNLSLINNTNGHRPEARITFPT
jgi:hypothetical protein